MFLSGSQVAVVGETTPGASQLAANYTIDDGSATMNAISALSGNSSINGTVFFQSSLLDFGEHVLTIDVTNTGLDRNYTLWSFYVNEEVYEAQEKSKKSNTRAIVGAALGVVFLILSILLSIYFYRRRKMKKVRLAKELKGMFNQIHLTHL